MKNKNSTNTVVTHRTVDLDNLLNQPTNQEFNARIRVVDGKVYVRKVEKRVKVNQYTSRWVPVNSREFARKLNKSDIVIK